MTRIAVFIALKVVELAVLFGLVYGFAWVGWKIDPMDYHVPDGICPSPLCIKHVLMNVMCGIMYTILLPAGVILVLLLTGWGIHANWKWAKRIIPVIALLLFAVSAEARMTQWISPEGFAVGYDDLVAEPQYPATGKWIPCPDGNIVTIPEDAPCYKKSTAPEKWEYKTVISLDGIGDGWEAYSVTIEDMAEWGPEWISPDGKSRSASGRMVKKRVYHLKRRMK
jgi:hypothetical protein